MKVARWRIAAAALVVGGLLLVVGMIAPVYIHNLELQNFVSSITARPDIRQKSDDILRTWVLDKAHELQLPIRPDNVQIQRSPEGIGIDVRYFVRVSFPGYTVDLHFYPGAGSH